MKHAVLCHQCRRSEAETYIPYSRQRLCVPCFNAFFENRIRKTVEKHRMFKADDIVGVAVSGGKDSASLIHALRNIYPELRLRALHVNLGIEGYSDHCAKKAEAMSEATDAEFLVYDLKGEDGVSVDLFTNTMYRRKTCSPCGLIKRRLFDVLARRSGVRVLATAHNIDDVVSIYLSGFFSGEFTYIARMKPVHPPLTENMSTKVKPLFKTPEAEAAYYAALNGLPASDVKCPYSKGNVEFKYKRMIGFMEQNDPGFKFGVLSLFMKKLLPLIKEEERSIRSCITCGLPSTNEVCGYCKRMDLLKKLSLQDRR